MWRCCAKQCHKYIYWLMLNGDVPQEKDRNWNEAVNEFNTIYFVQKEQMCVHQLGEQATINHVWAAVCPLIISKWLEKNPSNRIIRVSKHTIHTHTHTHTAHVITSEHPFHWNVQNCSRVTLSVEWIFYIRQGDSNRHMLKKKKQYKRQSSRARKEIFWEHVK